MATSIAKFPYVRDLAGFDFKAQPSLDPKQIRDLATGRFIANGQTLLLLGPPGVGKTRPTSPWRSTAPIDPSAARAHQ
jgi:DNA replication protein DnaC